MHTESLDRWQHDHIFGQDQQRVGEKRTLIVIAVTATMMVVEITTGIMFGSMALLADGLHMGSHAVALLIALIAYIYARRHAGDERFSFGTGKVNALAGFSGAVLLAVFAIMMAWESVDRLLNPVAIQFNSAILVAVLGLLVNGGCALILDAGHSHDHDHHHDHNLRSAYLHVIADALTSVLAIAALLTGKYLGWNWMDPVMGVVGATLVARWSVGLLRTSAGVLLDHQAPAEVRAGITNALESEEGDRVADLHVWSIGPGIWAAELVVVTHDPQPAEHYKGLLPDELHLVHVSVEVHRCPGPD
ncbi:MAG: CDF family Co(II)/Ni(II) efflux transporter DmeF [Planctomycetota bacterium]|jgi:cation diffusion facilitator family transporter